MASPSPSVETIQEIAFDLIDDPKAPMRSDLNRDALWELAESIKTQGIINPPTVRPVEGRFEIVAGHRRFAAAKMAGLVKARFVVREMQDEKAAEVMAHENLFREDVDPVDEAVFIGELVNRFGWSVPMVASKVNRSQKWVTERLMVLDMPDYMIAAIKTGGMALGVALQLVQIDDERQRRVWTNMAAQDKITVRQAEYWLLDYRKNKDVYAAALDAGGVEDAPPPPVVQQVLCERCGVQVPITETRAAMVHRGLCPEDRPHVEVMTEHSEPRVE